MSADYEPFEEMDGDEEYKIRCLFADIDFDKFMSEDDEYTLTRRVGAFFSTKERTRFVGIISYLYSASVYVPYCDDGKIATADFNGQLGVCVYTIPDIIPVDVAMEFRWVRKKFKSIYNPSDERLFLVNYAGKCVALPHAIIKRLYAMMDKFEGKYTPVEFAEEVAAIKQMVVPRHYFKKRNKYVLFRECCIGIPNYTYVRQEQRWLSITKDDGSEDGINILAIDKIIQLED